MASVSLNAFAAKGGASESDITLITVIVAIWFVLSFIILIRLWKATNDVKALKAKICDKGIAERSILRSEVMKLHLLGKDEEAFEIINNALYGEARKLYRATNDTKDYKEMVFLPGQDGGKTLSCQDYYQTRWKELKEKYIPLYNAIGYTIPQGLSDINYLYIKTFGKPEQPQ